MVGRAVPHELYYKSSKPIEQPRFVNTGFGQPSTHGLRF